MFKFNCSCKCTNILYFLIISTCYFCMMFSVGKRRNQTNLCVMSRLLCSVLSCACNSQWLNTRWCILQHCKLQNEEKTAFSYSSCFSNFYRFFANYFCYKRKLLRDTWEDWNRLQLRNSKLHYDQYCRKQRIDWNQKKQANGSLYAVHCSF